jgi:hypothetical protein
MSTKKSFILHVDSLSFLDELTNEQAGTLFKAIRDFHIGKEPELEFGLKMAFIPLRAQFIRDSEKWEKINTIRKDAGSKGGRPRKAKKANGFEENQTEPNQTNLKENNPVNGNVNVNVNVNGNVNGNKISFGEFWDLYDKKVGDRQKCEKKWNTLSLAVQEKIIAFLPEFKKTITDKQFQPYPQTFLNGKRWEDEIQIPAGTEKKFKCEASNSLGFYYPMLTEKEFQEKVAAGVRIKKL